MEGEREGTHTHAVTKIKERLFPPPSLYQAAHQLFGTKKCLQRCRRRRRTGPTNERKKKKKRVKGHARTHTHMRTSAAYSCSSPRTHSTTTTHTHARAVIKSANEQDKVKKVEVRAHCSEGSSLPLAFREGRREELVPTRACVCVCVCVGVVCVRAGRGIRLTSRTTQRQHNKLKKMAACFLFRSAREHFWAYACM